MILKAQCRVCNERKLLIPRHWIRSKNDPSGFDTRICKECQNKRAEEYRRREMGAPMREITGKKYNFPDGTEK